MTLIYRLILPGSGSNRVKKEMSVSFSLDRFKMPFHFQNALSFSKCAFIFKMSDGDKFFNAFEGTRITKALFCLPNRMAFLSLNSTSYKWRLPIDAQYENPGGS